MIELTVAQIAEIVGGAVADISRKTPRTAASPGPSSSTRAPSARAGCSSPCRGRAPTATTMPRRR